MSLERFDELPDPIVEGLRESGSHEDSPHEIVPQTLIDAARSVRIRPEASPWHDGRRRLGKFELLEQLGMGSFACVYRGRDVELNRTVAIKVPRSHSLASREDIDRFLREARSAAQLKHPGIVLLYGTGQTEEGTLYLVEEFIEGTTLADRFKASRLSYREAAELVAEVCDALDYAHQHGVIHRDIKPSNIMFDREGHPHLMDFGLAKLQTDEATMTLEGEVMGTPAYMSPEQARGESHQVDARTDIYSLGVVLYEGLTGQVPFRGNRRTLIQQVMDEDPRPPRWVNDRVPRDLDTICLKAMSKLAAHRYASSREMADDLRRYLAGDPIRARPISVGERVWRWCRRNPLAASLFVAISLSSAVGMWHLSHLSGQLVRRSALDSAAMQAEMLETVNAFYSSEIVERLGHHGIDATTEYAVRDRAIPLPATFLTALGKLISESETGMQVRHFSDFPFKSRRDGGPQDDFERQALQHFRDLPARPGKPDEPYFAFTDYQSVPVLRFATPRRMQASCVRCHNSHPDSTKTDWQVGEVRGVLEIIRPLDRDIARTREGLRGTFIIMAGSSLLFAVLCGLVLLAGNRGRAQATKHLPPQS